MTGSRNLLPLAAAVIVAAAILGAPTAARAGFAVQVYDDGVLQGGISTLAVGNSLLFSGSTTHFSITNGSGLSNNPGTPFTSNLNLSNNEQISTTFGATGGTHTIQIVLSQTDFLAPVGSTFILSSSAGGSMAYLAGTNPSATESVSATYQGFLDNTNTLFGMPGAGSTPLQSASAAASGVGTSPLVFAPGASVNGNVPGGVPFSMTDVLTLTLTLDPGSGQDTANATATSAAAIAPEPCSLVLALAGVPALGIGTWIRRRRM
jgi:hypothetical protein